MQTIDFVDLFIARNLRKKAHLKTKGITPENENVIKPENEHGIKPGNENGIKP